MLSGCNNESNKQITKQTTKPFSEATNLLMKRWKKRSEFQGKWDPKDPKCWEQLQNMK